MRWFFRFKRTKPFSDFDGNKCSDFHYDKPNLLLNNRESHPDIRLMATYDIGESHPDQTHKFLDIISSLVDDVASAEDPSSHKAKSALRQLFTMSEQYSPNGEQIVEMVKALLDFLERCLKKENHKSAALYPALLVLNSISIPLENKRIILLDLNGTNTLCRILMHDPSCHMALIVLTNLTFTNGTLRSEILLAESSKNQLIPTLAYVVRVGSLSRIEYEEVHHVIDHKGDSGLVTAQEKLSLLVQYDVKRFSTMACTGTILSSENFVFADTVRWSLCVMNNLSRPGKDSQTAAISLIRCGIIPHILRLIKVQEDKRVLSSNLNCKSLASSTNNSLHSNDSQIKSSPSHAPRRTVLNPPSRWSSQLAQDTALFIIMNISTVSSTIDYLLHETPTVDIMLRIIRFYYRFEKKRSTLLLTEVDDQKQARLQCLKARIILSYLLGSFGHFGQRHRARIDEGKYGKSPFLISENILILQGESEVLSLVELIANSLNQNPKEGPGGYLSVMFNIKYVLFALRCMLTHPKNQSLIGGMIVAVKLNCLLLKAIAIYGFNPDANLIDSEAAEFACFSLYLLSNFGFRVSFMPQVYGHHRDVADGIVAKVLFAYKGNGRLGQAAEHAARQLLLRLPYLKFNGDIMDSPDPLGKSRQDFELDNDLQAAINKVAVVGEVYHGTEPMLEIFNRPIYGLWIPLKKIPSVIGGEGSWNSVPEQKSASGKIYDNALQAVQDISFGSHKYRHDNSKIDDIQVANHIVLCADAITFESTESYNHAWRWLDSYDILFGNENRPILGTSNQKNLPSDSWSSWGVGYKMMVSNLCGNDTSI